MLDTVEQSERRKVRTVFLIDPAERDALDHVSAVTGAPLSELLRRCVAYWLAKRVEALESQAGPPGGITPRPVPAAADRTHD